MSKKPNIASKMFILSWVLIPLLALWISTNYIIGLGRDTTWSTSANQELVQSVSADTPQQQPLTWSHGALVTLWFDDAWSTQYNPAFSMMEKFNFTGALAVPTHAVGTDGYMNWAQIKGMQHKGWEITSHSQSHNCKPEDLTSQFEDRELKGAKYDLNSHGIYADNYVAPCGTITPGAISAAKQYYSSFRTSTDGTNALPIKNPYDLKVRTVFRDTTLEDVNGWINEAKDHDVWLILVFHQIDDGTSDYGTNEGLLEQSLNAVKASRIPVVLPNQVLQMKVK